MNAPLAISGRSGPGAASRPRWRSLLGPAVATAIALAMLIGLGIWQIERKARKEGLLAQIHDRAYGSPGEAVPESLWPSWRADADEFRRVRLRGRWLGDKTIPIHGLAELRRGQAAQGSYLFTPMRLAGGETVVVNRGFVPTEALAETLSRLRSANSTADVTGLVRAPEERGWFVPENQPGRSDWFVRNLDDIARAERLDRVAPFYIDEYAAANPSGWPIGGQTQLTLRNNHLQYAFTWFGLGGALVGVFAVYATKTLGPSRRS